MSKSKRNIVEVGTDEMIQMQIEISLGVKKKDSKLDLSSKAMSDMYDEIEKNIKAMPKGMILDIRPEIP